MGADIEDYDDSLEDIEEEENGKECSESGIESLTLHGVTYSWPCENRIKEDKAKKQPQSTVNSPTQVGRTDPAVPLELLPVKELEETEQQSQPAQINEDTKEKLTKDSNSNKDEENEYETERLL